MSEVSENPVICESGEISFGWNVCNNPFTPGKAVDTPICSLFSAEWFIRVFPPEDSEYFRLFLRRKCFLNSPPFDHCIDVNFMLCNEGISDKTYWDNECDSRYFVFYRNYVSTPRLKIDEEEYLSLRKIFTPYTTLTIYCTISLLDYVGYEGLLPMPVSIGFDSISEISLNLDDIPNLQEDVPEASLPQDDIPNLQEVVPEASLPQDTIPNLLEVVPITSMPQGSSETLTEQDIAPQKSMAQGIKTLSLNFKELLDTGLDADVTIKVNGRIFQAHRLILKTRCPVFSSMFQHDMKEKSSGVIHIDDCEPDPFYDFLLYLYSGKVDHVASSNAHGLYQIADKYDVAELKDACVLCVRRNMSVESFCDTVLIAAMHNEEDLMQSAANYFIFHAEDILESRSWQAFLPEHPTLANELLKKFVLTDNKYREMFKNWERRLSRCTQS